MKKLIIFITLCFAIASIQMQAQSICSCTPDTNCEDPEDDGAMYPHPDDWPSGTKGTYYELQLTIDPMESANVGGTTVNLITALEVTQVLCKLTTEKTFVPLSNYGFSYCRNVVKMPSKGHVLSCVVLSGTPNVAGDIQLKVTFKAYAGSNMDLFLKSLDSIIGIVKIVEPTVPPVSDFNATNTTVNIGDSVEFNDFSTNATSWLWSFGDGGTSTEQNPKHKYTDNGKYTVALSVSNNVGKDTKIEPDYIKVGTGEGLPKASFIPVQKDIYVGDTAIFVNTSSNANTYSWDFGDGDTSTLAQPKHQYTTQGDYEITLTASKDGANPDVFPNWVKVRNKLSKINYEADNSIIIYPNPANEEIMVKADRCESITILDVRGLVVSYTQSNQTITPINISNLPNAVYIIKVKTAEGMFTKGFLKQ